jgi:hypothetical protein
VSLRGLPGEAVDDVARRAVTRPREVRFDPVVVVADTGHLLGVVRVERLVHHLAEGRGADLLEDR